MSAISPSLVGETDMLLQQMGEGGSSFELIPLSGGANNKVFRIERENRPQLVVKHYFFSPEDKRDRFHAEKSFYDFLQAAGLQQHVPRAMAWDREHRLGLFSWVEGHRIRPDEITVETIDQALQLHLGANAKLYLPEAAAAPDASEACFGLVRHFESVERRLSRFASVENNAPVDRDAIEFISRQLKPAFVKYQEAAGKVQDTWDEKQRCLSPSDFGFHNALLQGDGKLAFFDFEYAGWDDPAKFLCDFLCQPAVPIPPSLWPHWIQSLCRPIPGGTTQERVALLLPIYHIKWCCILLNEFLPQEQKRRLFSLKLSPEEMETKKRDQLNKAQNLLENLTRLDLSSAGLG